MLVIIIVSTL